MQWKPLEFNSKEHRQSVLVVVAAPAEVTWKYQILVEDSISTNDIDGSDAGFAKKSPLQPSNYPTQTAVRQDDPNRPEWLL